MRPCQFGKSICSEPVGYCSTSHWETLCYQVGIGVDESRENMSRISFSVLPKSFMVTTIFGVLKKSYEPNFHDLDNCLAVCLSSPLLAGLSKSTNLSFWFQSTETFLVD